MTPPAVISRLRPAPIPAASHETAERFVADLPEGGTLIACGITGYGKTTTIQAGLAGSRRLLVVDPYASLDRRRDAIGKGRRRTWQGDLWTHDELLANPDPIRVEPMRIIYDPGTLDTVKMGNRIAALLELLWEDGDVDVVLEEAGLYSRSIIKMVNQLCTGAGHSGLRLFVIVQGYSRITLDARRNPSRLLLFAQVDDSDYGELQPKIGAHGVERLRMMQPGEAPLLWKIGQLSQGAA